MGHLRGMAVFVAVAKHASFSGAAVSLGMSRPAVTRAIAALEDRVGAQLILRTTRSLALTQAGDRYLEDAQRILRAVDEASAAARGSYSAPEGLLTLTAPVMFGRLHVMPVLRAFLEKEPKVRADVRLLDRVTNLVEDGFDVALRIGQLPDSGLMASKVGHVSRMVVGSPAYLERFGAPESPKALNDHRLIIQAGRRRWRFPGGERRVSPQITVNDVPAALDLAKAGFGLAQVLSYQCAGAVKEGRLIPVLVDHQLPPIPVHLVFGGGRRIPGRVRAFVDYATQALRDSAAKGWT